MSTVSSIVRASVSDIVRSIVAGESGGGAPEPDSLLTDLVAWWSLDEASGTRVNVHNPGTHDLTDNNTVGQTTGVVGNAAAFVVGNNEYLSLAHHSDFVIADSPFSIAGWAKFSSSSETGCALFCKGNAAASAGEYVVERFTTNQSVRFRVRNAANSATVAVGPINITYDTWFFYIAEHVPDSDIIRLEIDRGTPLTAAISGGVYSGTNNIKLGQGVSSNNELDGAQDEPVIARRIWTDEEKDRLYHSGTGMAYPA